MGREEKEAQRRLEENRLRMEERQPGCGLRGGGAEAGGWSLQRPGKAAHAEAAAAGGSREAAAAAAAAAAGADEGNAER